MASSAPPASPVFRSIGRISYDEGLALQERLVAERLAGEIEDTVLLLEHEPVYTIGRTRNRSSLGDGDGLPFPVYETNRGGEATFHGPGQLVGYPIIDLAGQGRDLHRYLRVLEETLIAACRDYGVAAARREGLTGVWIDERKIASIGVGVRRWISMHGFAFNVGSDLSGFRSITPCGLAGVTMTSLSLETGREIGVATFADTLQPHLAAAFARNDHGSTRDGDGQPGQPRS